MIDTSLHISESSIHVFVNTQRLQLCIKGVLNDSPICSLEVYLFPENTWYLSCFCFLLTDIQVFFIMDTYTILVASVPSVKGYNLSIYGFTLPCHTLFSSSVAFVIASSSI